MNQQLMAIFDRLYDEDQKSLKSVDIADCFKKSCGNSYKQNFQIIDVRKLIDGKDYKTFE